METAFEHRIQQMLDELKANPMLEIRRLDERPIDDYMGNTPEEALAKIDEFTGITVPRGLGANFHRQGGLHVTWRAEADDDHAGGEFVLVHFGLAILDTVPDWPADVATTDEEAELFGQFRFFDGQPDGGGGTTTGFRLVEDAEPTEVWHFDPYIGFLKLDIDYGTYLDMLLHTRGAYSWPYLFIDPAEAMSVLTGVVKSLTVGLDFLTRAFPKDDFSDLLDRLAVRQRVVDEYWASQE